MNKKEKEENITQIADTIAFEMKHELYEEINEHIFDRNLAKESDDKTYQTIYKEIYNKVINKTKTREKTKSDTAYRKAVQAKDKFTQGLYGTSGEQTEEAVLFDDQINGIFNTWGTELNDQISEIQAGGGAESEVTDLTNAYIQKVNRFTTDMANWEAARLEYQKAKQAAAEGGYNSVGTLLSSPDQQRNPELISMFNAMTDDELDNLLLKTDEESDIDLNEDIEIQEERINDIKMVQLFFNPENDILFKEAIEKISKRDNIDNISDAVLKAVLNETPKD